MQLYIEIESKCKGWNPAGFGFVGTMATCESWNVLSAKEFFKATLASDSSLPGREYILTVLKYIERPRHVRSNWVRALILVTEGCYDSRWKTKRKRGGSNYRYNGTCNSF